MIIIQTFKITNWNISIYSVNIRNYILNLQYQISLIFLNTKQVTYQETAKPSTQWFFNSWSLLLIIYLVNFVHVQTAWGMFCLICATNPKLLCHRVLLYTFLCLIDVVFLLYLARWVCWTMPVCMQEKHMRVLLLLCLKIWVLQKKWKLCKEWMQII